MLNKRRMSPTLVSALSLLTCNEVVPVPAVFPAAVVGDGFQDLGGGAPAFLRRRVTIGFSLSS